MAEPLLFEPEALRASIARESLKDFVHEAWHIVEPQTRLVWNWHLDELCAVLEAVTCGELSRVIVNVPPGTMKSLLFSVLWPSWEWATYPSYRYLTASYSDVNTIRDNRSCRDIVTSDWFYRHFWDKFNPEVRLDIAQKAKIRFDTTAKGWRIATSVGGAGTGQHPDRVIVDDPIKAEDAKSEPHRIANINWFEGTMSTRISRNPAFLVIMQRLHMDDLSGYLLGKGGWEHVCFPMRFRPKGGWLCPCHESAPDKRDHRRRPNELLWSEHFPEKKVAQEEEDLGAYGTAGQLAQDPIPPGGAMIKREWLPIVEALPKRIKRWVRGWDTAGTVGGGDWTSGVLLAEDEDGIIYVVHVARAQTDEVDRVIVNTAKADGKHILVREEQEPASSGKAVIKDHAKKLAGFDFEGMPISGDKPTRMRPFRAQAKAGNVRVLRGEWNHSYIDCLVSFPFGRHDDDADATSCAYNALVEAPINKKTRLTWGRGRTSDR